MKFELADFLIGSIVLFLNQESKNERGIKHVGY